MGRKQTVRGQGVALAEGVVGGVSIGGVAATVGSRRRLAVVAAAAAALLLASSLAVSGCAAQPASDSDAAVATNQESASDRSARLAAQAQQAYEDEMSAQPSESAYAAREAAMGILDAVAACDAATVEPYLSKSYFDPAVCGLSYDEFIAGFFNGFTYEIVGLRDMRDGSVEVQVSFTTRDGKQATELIGETYQQAADAGNTAAMAAYASEVWPNVGRISIESPFALYMAQNDEGAWVVEDGASFGAALLGGYDVRQEG